MIVIIRYPFILLQYIVNKARLIQTKAASDHQGLTQNGYFVIFLPKNQALTSLLGAIVE